MSELESTIKELNSLIHDRISEGKKLSDELSNLRTLLNIQLDRAAGLLTTFPRSYLRVIPGTPERMLYRTVRNSAGNINPPLLQSTSQNESATMELPMAYGKRNLAEATDEHVFPSEERGCGLKVINLPYAKLGLPQSNSLASRELCPATSMSIPVEHQNPEKVASTHSNGFARNPDSICCAEELEVLRLIGPTQAKAIIDYCRQNGDFKTFEDIQKVKGIKSVEFSKISVGPVLTLPGSKEVLHESTILSLTTSARCELIVFVFCTSPPQLRFLTRIDVTVQ